jgi:hypothetical protein
MSLLISIIGFGFFFAGFFSLAGLTNFGLYYAALTQLHTLPVLRNFSPALDYTLYGLLLLIIAPVFKSGRNSG